MSGQDAEPTPGDAVPRRPDLAGFAAWLTRLGVGTAPTGGPPTGTGEPGGAVHRKRADVSAYDVVLAPEMTREEFVRLLEGEVPAEARFVEAGGDVDYVLVWEVDDPGVLGRLVAAEAAAWREWRDADCRQRDFARLHRHAYDHASQAHEAWRQVAAELARRHPNFEELTGRGTLSGQPTPETGIEGPFC